MWRAGAHLISIFAPLPSSETCACLQEVAWVFPSNAIAAWGQDRMSRGVTDARGERQGGPQLCVGRSAALLAIGRRHYRSGWCAAVCDCVRCGAITVRSHRSGGAFNKLLSTVLRFGHRRFPGWISVSDWY